MQDGHLSLNPSPGGEGLTKPCGAKHLSLNPSTGWEGLTKLSGEKNLSLNPSPGGEGLTKLFVFGERPVPLLLQEKGSGG
jgi:hypothetical protein